MNSMAKINFGVYLEKDMKVHYVYCVDTPKCSSCDTLFAKKQLARIIDYYGDTFTRLLLCDFCYHIAKGNETNFLYKKYGKRFSDADCAYYSAIILTGDDIIPSDFEYLPRKRPSFMYIEKTI